MATWRIWPSTSGPAITADATTTDLGTEFYVTQPGCTIAGYWWWLPATGDTTAASYSFALYSTTNGTSGSLITGTTVTSGFTLTAGGWNFITVSPAVALTSGTRYRAVTHYSGSSNHYGSTASYFTGGGGGAADIVNGPLTCPTAANALNASQGSFNEPSAALAFPSSTFNQSNYWIDVLVDDGVPLSGQPMVPQAGSAVWRRRFARVQQPWNPPAQLPPPPPPFTTVSDFIPGQAWPGFMTPGNPLTPAAPVTAAPPTLVARMAGGSAAVRETYRFNQ